MKRLAFFLVVIGFALSAHFACAAPATGVELLEECQLATRDTDSLTTSHEFVSATHCLGYLQGAADSFRLWEDENGNLKTSLPAPACIPAESSAFELAKVVVKYINDHPKRLHNDYSEVVTLALRNAYPCKP